MDLSRVRDCSKIIGRRLFFIKGKDLCPIINRGLRGASRRNTGKPADPVTLPISSVTSRAAPPLRAVAAPLPILLAVGTPSMVNFNYLGFCLFDVPICMYTWSCVLIDGW